MIPTRMPRPLRSVYLSIAAPGLTGHVGGRLPKLDFVTERPPCAPAPGASTRPVAIRASAAHNAVRNGRDSGWRDAMSPPLYGWVLNCRQERVETRRSRIALRSAV